MNITVEDVLKLSCLNNCTVVAGASGLQKTVRWFFSVMTSMIIPWIHGHEILFIYGPGVDSNESSLCYLLDQCAEKDISAVFFIMGTYFTEIPDSVKQQADVYRIPIIEMPNEVPVVDITKDVADLLMYSQRVGMKKGNLLKNVIFGNKTSHEELLLSIKNHETYIKIGKYHNIIAISTINDTVEQIPLTDSYIQQSMYSAFGDVLYFIEPNNTIILLYSDDVADPEIKKTKLEKFIAGFENLSSYKINGVGIGSLERSLANLGKSYSNALKALATVPKFPADIIHDYESLEAVDKLIFEVDSSDVLYDCFKNTIGKLISYDSSHESDLLETLQTFLRENGSILNSAKALYIHRNTMKYRVDKISEIMGMDVEDIGNMHELYFSMKCYKKYIFRWGWID